MTKKLSIPLPDADQYYDLLLQNDKTEGTNEQKMLVLRRRFDRILRDVTGPFQPSSNFYKESMEAIKRMTKFVSLLTKVEIPLELSSIIEKKKVIATKGKIPVFCCISSTSIIEKENRDQFNNAALKFRNELLSDSRIKDRIKFTFLVTTDEGIVVRDMSDRPAGNPTPTKTPREHALLFAAQELSNQNDGMMILLYGGKKLQLSDNIVSTIKQLNSSIQVYPISLDQENLTFEDFPFEGQFYQMIPGCYEEFFNWLYDTLVLLYQ